MTLALDVLAPGIGRPYLDGDSLDWSQPLVFTVVDLLSAAECEQLVARIDALGPTLAPISAASGEVAAPDVRNNTRVMFDDPALAAELFGRVREALPAPLCGQQPCGTNERFRCYRYQPGQRFAPHFDGAFRRGDEGSLLTFMVYLNDGAEGGATVFHDLDVRVAPRRGMALLFQHMLLHEGSTVHEGVKYVLRTDVMYRRG